MKRKAIMRGSQDLLYLWKLLALVGHGLHSLPPGPSVRHPMSASQDTSVMQPGNNDACLGLDPKAYKAPFLETLVLARVFRGREGKGGRQTAWIDLTRRGTWLESRMARSALLKHQETLRQAAGS